MKTPLTVILANTDIVISHKEDTIHNQMKWIDYIKTEAERMTTLVNDLLFLAKTDAHKNEVIFSRINFSDTVWNCVLPFESVAFEQEKAIDSDIASDVFERFYRVDESRAREKDGYGLGLSIAKSIIETHHGKIAVKSSESKGTTFTVSFPLIRNK